MFLPVLLAGLFLLFPLQARAQLGCDGVTVSMCYGAACQPYAENQPKILPSQSPIHFDLVNAVAGETYSLLVEYEKIGSNVSQKIITKKVDGQVGQRVTVRDFLIADQYEYRDLFYFQEADANETPGYKMLSLVAPNGKVCPFIMVETFTVDASIPSCKNTKEFDGLCGAKGGCTPGSKCEYNLLFGGECVESLDCGGSLRCGLPGTENRCARDGGCLDGEQCVVSAVNGASCEQSEVNCGFIKPLQCGDIGTHYICGEMGGCPTGQYCDQSRAVCISSFHCDAKPPIGKDPAPPQDGGGTDGATEEETEPTLDIFAGPNANDFKLLNPLQMFESPYADKFSSPAGIINRVLLFAFPLAGLILFVMIVWGGFEILSVATNSKGVQAGKQRITAALLGFGLLFVSFWIIQIVEYIFNLAIL